MSSPAFAMAELKAGRLGGGYEADGSRRFTSRVRQDILTRPAAAAIGVALRLFNERT
jgi:hypothetical protein